MTQSDHWRYGILHSGVEATSIAIALQVISEVVDFKKPDAQITAVGQAEVGTVLTTVIIDAVTGPSYLGPAAIRISKDAQRVWTIDLWLYVFRDYEFLKYRICVAVYVGDEPINIIITKRVVCIGIVE